MQKFKVGAYLRLSNDDGDRFESNSISSQRVIIENYIKNHAELELTETFTDDGYTGTNFRRPGINKLLQAVEKGSINCVVVKDLSRFGRDYIDTGYYLERYFPANNVRFIAINDAYDSGQSTSSDEFMMPLKNVINAHYSKDISKKVKSAFKAKQMNGEFVGAFASYGYQKEAKDKHKLMIDEEAAAVVRRIFQLYIGGAGKITIAKILNDEQVPCPSEYKKMKGLNYRNSNRLTYTSYWTYSTIHNILQNEMYIGNMVQNRYIRKMVHGNATKLAEDDWIIVKNTHQPIIEYDVWNVAQELLKKRTRQLNHDSELGLFSGFIKCGDCGRSLSKIRRRTSVYYVCGSYKRYTKHVCSSHELKEDMLEKLLLDKLNAELEKMDEIKVPDCSAPRRKVDNQAYHIRLEKIYRLKKELYEDLKQGLLTKEEYASYKEDYQKEESRIHEQLDSIEHQAVEDKEKNEWVENLKKFKRLDRLDRETLACVLDSITVYETDKEKRLDIKLKYTL